MKNHASRFLIYLTAIFVLSGCTEVQFASQTVKDVYHPNNGRQHPAAQQGTFKVGSPYQVEGQWYYPKEEYDLVETGLASWYGPGFDGHHTASGETYHSDELTAAHRTLQMPSLVRVTNLDNGRSIIVRVNDRGPYRRGRVMDVSSKAAELLGMKGTGTAKVRLQVLNNESLRLAQLAKSGQNTRGYELAANGFGGSPLAPGLAANLAAPMLTQSTPQQPYQTASIAAVSRENLPVSTPVPGHMDQGTFYPDPIVTHVPVTPTGIYVQAGSFTVSANAERLRQSLQLYNNAKTEDATINGQHFYRVRLGPIATVNEADNLLARMIRDGHSQAIIVVE